MEFAGRKKKYGVPTYGKFYRITKSRNRRMAEVRKVIKHRLNEKLNQEVKIYELICKKCGTKMDENSLNEPCGPENSSFHFF